MRTTPRYPLFPWLVNLVLAAPIASERKLTCDRMGALDRPAEEPSSQQALEQGRSERRYGERQPVARCVARRVRRQIRECRCRSTCREDVCCTFKSSNPGAGDVLEGVGQYLVGPAGAWRAQPCDSRSSPRARILSMCPSTDIISSPRCLDHFSKRRAALALRQPALRLRQQRGSLLQFLPPA
jgi:hypothetical protein